MSEHLEERADRAQLETELLRPRGFSDGPIGLFAIQLAIAKWIGGIFKRRKAESEDNG